MRPFERPHHYCLVPRPLPAVLTHRPLRSSSSRAEPLAAVRQNGDDQKQHQEAKTTVRHPSVRPSVSNSNKKVLSAVSE